MEYLVTIGLEIHVQVGTRSKMFCRCSASVFGEPPNTHTCPVCLGLPGALPVPNAEAIKLALLAGEALGSDHPEVTRFDRKNYFYPDLPKGYQISQFDLPLNTGGSIKVGDREIKITRAHLEEDTGRLQHSADKSFVDYNRSSLPLLEIVSEPDITSAEEARSYAQKIQQLMRYAGVSEADMEKGSLRVDANVSIRPAGQEELNPKVEIKNMNSFRSIERALKFEINRQTQAYDSGEKVTQETRGWDEAKGVTFSQRTKEDSHDYRYFPEPDIPPIRLTQEILDEVKSMLPELPDAKLERYQSEFSLKQDLAETLVADRQIAELFERAAEELSSLSSQTRLSSEVLTKEESGIQQFEVTGEQKGKPNRTRTNDLSNVILNDSEGSQNVSDRDSSALPQNDTTLITNLITHLGNLIRREVLTLVNQGQSLEKLEPAMLAELVIILDEGKIPASSTSSIVREMLGRGVMPAKIAEEKGLTVNTNQEELTKLAQEVLNENPDAVTEFKAGKEQVIGFLIGALMKKSAGQANPEIARSLLLKSLNS